MFEALHFIRPWWLLALLPAIYLTLRWWRGQRSAARFETSIDPELLAVLLEPGTEATGRRQPALLLLGLTLAVLALAGPSWERLPQPVERDADGLVIVFDLSLSMYVEDVTPSRLVRARQKITDLLRLRQQGFTGLIAYAGDAHAVAPLTDDTRTIINLLASLAPEMMPVLGSDPAAALELAQELFRNAGFQQGRIILVTDGVDQLNPVLQLRNTQYPISVLGVGTAAGGPIPLEFAKQPGRVLRNQSGEIIRPKLDDGRLEEVARVCYGRYRAAQVGDADVTALLATPLPGTDETAASDRLFDIWADRGHWLALLALPLLALAFRRGLLVCAPPLLFGSLALLLLGAGLGASPSSVAATSDGMTLEEAPAGPDNAAIEAALNPPGAASSWWSQLWQRPDQIAHEQLLEGRPEIAATLFENDRWRAVANYRAGDYAGAATTFSAEQSVDDQYNYGNALARLGNYEAAIEAYDRVLADDPANEDAQFNKELLERLQEEQQKQQSEQQDQSGEDQQQEQQSDSDSAEGSSGEPQDQDAPPEAGEQAPEEAPEDDPKDSEEAEAEQAGEEQANAEQSDESRDENAEALEQWLRRVPDDPGGLLRRKFQYETNQKLRSGELQRRDAEQIW